jgi:hypothetical protein
VRPPITRQTPPPDREIVVSTPESTDRTTESLTQTGEFTMHTTRRFARCIALPIVSAGILGGAALGLAGMANAGTYSYQPAPRPGIVATPNTIARPPVYIPRHRSHGFVIDIPSAE